MGFKVGIATTEARIPGTPEKYIERESMQILGRSVWPYGQQGLHGCMRMMAAELAGSTDVTEATGSHG